MKGIIVLLLIILIGMHLTESVTAHAPPMYNMSQEAARIADIGMRAAKETLARAYEENITEAVVVQAVENAMTDNGSNPYVEAFDTIVASGEDSAIPHGDPDDDETNQILPGEVVVVDLGARYRSQCSDETRTFFMGEPTEEQRLVYNIILEAQLAGIELVEVQILDNAGDIDYAVRSIIENYGYGDNFTHGTGHGVGFNIHEPPLITRDSEERLKQWDVVTIEPGIYLTGHFGVRIEDDLGVQIGGHEIITHYPKDIDSAIILNPEAQPEEGDNKNAIFDSHGNSGKIIIGIGFVAAAAVVYTSYKKKLFSKQLGKRKV